MRVLKEREDAPKRLLEGEDYYWEGPYMVFTRAYHLKRGYCCGSGCRHCPYSYTDNESDK
jgi:hypothetical protein